jgi:hypothetical protein
MAPAGDIWSVVTVSPSSRKRALVISSGCCGRQGKPVEVGRVFDVGGCVVPGKGGAFGNIKGIPEAVTVEDACIFFFVKFFFHVGFDQFVDLIL